MHRFGLGGTKKAVAIGRSRWANVARLAFGLWVGFALWEGFGLGEGVGLGKPGRVLQGSAFGAEQPAEDTYVRYLRSAPEFQPVRQDPAALLGRWNTWIYMPWRYQWTIGTDDPGGRFCQEYGINGGFTDHGHGPLDWLEKWNLRFYNDHTAGKGFLYLRGANQRSNFARFQRDPRAIRSGTDGPQPIDQAMLRRLTELITRNVGNIKRSPMRVAYALDDEISWGAFVIPLPWRLYEDEADYQAWLHRYYGGQGPKAQYVTPDFILPQLKKPPRPIGFQSAAGPDHL